MAEIIWLLYVLVWFPGEPPITRLEQIPYQTEIECRQDSIRIMKEMIEVYGIDEEQSSFHCIPTIAAEAWGVIDNE